MDSKFKTKLISVTPNAEKNIMYCARVSNPNNQNSENPKLIDYCIKKKHWSIFEQAFMTIEIKTSSSISMQILRHRSFCFQQFSQRFASVNGSIIYKARRQDIKNRQNSIDDIPKHTQKWFEEAQHNVWDFAEGLYQDALEKGIAKECARFLLPNSAKTTMYMSGNLRSWIHYIELRTSLSTQKEHRDIADGCKKIFVGQFPDIAKALEW